MTNLPGQPQPRKKVTSVLTVIWVLSVAAPLFLATPRPAHAFPVEDLFLEADAAAKQVKEVVHNNLTEGVIIATTNFVSYFLNQIAATMAENLVAGNWGQKSFFQTKDGKSLFADAASNALGDSIAVLSESGGFSQLGINLCDPNTNLSLQIQLGLLNENKLQGPRCKLDDIAAAYQRFKDENFTYAALAKKQAEFFKPGNSPLAVSLEIFRKVNVEIIPQRKAEELKNFDVISAAGGWEPVRDPVTGQVKAPASVAQEEFTAYRETAKEKGEEYNALSNVGAVASGSVMQVISGTVNTFVGTLTSKLLNAGIGYLLTLGKDNTTTSGTSYALSNPTAGVVRPSRLDVRTALATVYPTPAIREVDQYDLTSLMIVCPSVGRQPFNCVMDAQMANAVRAGGTQPFTVSRAVKEGLLHGEWPLISAQDPRDKDPYCYTYGYCESNLKKLRSARVLPIGWEMAASQSPVGQPIRLKDIVAKFNDCNEQGTADAQHNWCHLIDPDWVLKQPPTRCLAMAYGPILASSQAAGRLETCADLASCLREDDAGQCVGGYGYCTRERSVWRFNGDSCPEQFNTCRTLQPRVGASQVSLLMNTIDYGSCNADNIGCRAYSLLPNAVNCTLNSTCQAATGCRCSVTDGCTVEKDQRSCSTASGEVCALPQLKCAAAGGCNCSVSHACLVAKGDRTCSSLEGVNGDSTDDWLATPARYFDKNAAACPAEDAGCTPLVQLGTGQSLNLVRNGGFEQSADGDGDGVADHPAYWLPVGMVPAEEPGAFSTDGTHSVSGMNAVKPTRLANSGQRYSGNCLLSSGACSQTGGCACTDHQGYSCLVPFGATSCGVGEYVMQLDLPIRQNQTYTLSAKFKASPPIKALAHLNFRDAYGQPVSLTAAKTPLDATNGDCKIQTGNLELSATAGDSFACTFVVTQPAVSADLALFGDGGDGDIWFDDVMLEEGGGTPFHESYGEASQLTYAKVAPEYLGCRGEATDSAECQKYAGVCRENEVGCNRYSPTNGDPDVPGIVGPQDRCPAECVGYDVFKQETSEFEGTPKFPIYFVPSTATACTAADIGCSEFTDIKTEQVAYYSKLRLCQDLTAPDTKVFYTWEGSDTTGFQLKAWNLKATASSQAASSSDVCGQAGCASTGVAPCTKLDSANNQVEKCVDQPADGFGFCTAADVQNGDFDCREFYDELGNRHFRRLSRTIIAVADCQIYRITTSTETDCRNTNGKWDTTKQDCLYQASSADSQNCSQNVNGCRAYKGNAATNVRTIATSDFEDGAGGWQVSGTQTDAAVSSEAITVGGHSLKLPSGGVQRVAVEVGGRVQAGRFYSVNFWARGGVLNLPLTVRFAEGAATYACSLPGGQTCPADAADGCYCEHATGMSCTVPAGAASCAIAPQGTTYPDCGGQPLGKCLSAFFADRVGTQAPKLLLSNDWRQYSLGPVSVADLKFGTGSTVLSLETDGSSEVFVDNVILKEVQDTISVVRDSWKTPASCDETLDGAPSPLEMLGCREYRDTAGQKLTLRSFNQLCRDRSVGCAAYSNTQNTPSQPYAETYNATCVLDQACGAANPGLTGTNCVCNYRVKNPLTLQVVTVKADACRVALNEKECRFTIDQPVPYEYRTDHPDIVSVPADARNYLVVTKATICPAASAGCRSFGAANLAYDGECKNFDANGQEVSCQSAAGCDCLDDRTGRRCVIKSGQNSCRFALESGLSAGWQKVAYKDDPAKYAQTLCLEREVGCEQYATAGSTYYFRDPGAQTCEFKENVPVESCNVVAGKLTCAQETRSGWFRQSTSGQNFPCYSDLLKQGDYFGIYKNADPGCRLAAPCAAKDGCDCSDASGYVCHVSEGNLSCGYAGWAGLCSPAYDRCEEFIDPLATSTAYPEGQPYYYLVNGQLDLSGCASGVNLKQGCVLLKRTSDTSRPYSAAGTYSRGIKEGANMTVPVGPVDCSRPEYQAFCQLRCFAYIDGRCQNQLDKPCRQDADCGAGDSCGGVESYGYGCSADADCDAAGGEKCVKPLTTGETCPAGQLCHADSKGRDLLANDANVVMKVRQDRECAEWLQCRQHETVWDQQTAKWKSICTDFGLCQEMRQVGQSYDCVRFGEADPRLLSRDIYSQRDISWRGADYTGYSLPFRYPTQSLMPVSLSQGYCYDLNGNEKSPPQPCRYNVDCPAGFQCGSTLGGVCRGTQNGDLDGRPCNPSSDNANIAKYCGNQGYCASSPLATQALGVSLSLCQGGANDGLPCVTNNYQSLASADCPGAGAVCRASCTSDSDCPSDERYNALVWPDDQAYRRGGTCYQHRCFYSFAGGKLIGSDAANRLSCRAYPQAEAPYGPSVLENGGSGSDYDSITGQPVKRTAAFQGANICTQGNDCDCSYLKVTYGQGDATHYFTGWGTVRGEVDAICVGGDDDGQPCGLGQAITSEACRTAGGKCVKESQRIWASGWPGFCLDRDQATPINRSSKDFACTLWLPVDQMAGMPDRYNQFREAGYQTDQPELLYCQDVESNKTGAINLTDTTRVSSSDPSIKDICVCPYPLVNGACPKVVSCTPADASEGVDAQMTVCNSNPAEDSLFCSISGQPCSQLNAACGPAYSRVVMFEPSGLGSPAWFDAASKDTTGAFTNGQILSRVIPSSLNIPMDQVAAIRIDVYHDLDAGGSPTQYWHSWGYLMPYANGVTTDATPQDQRFYSWARGRVFSVKCGFGSALADCNFVHSKFQSMGDMGMEVVAIPMPEAGWPFVPNYEDQQFKDFNYDGTGRLRVLGTTALVDNVAPVNGTCPSGYQLRGLTCGKICTGGGDCSSNYCQEVGLIAKFCGARPANQYDYPESEWEGTNVAPTCGSEQTQEQAFRVRFDPMNPNHRLKNVSAGICYPRGGVHSDSASLRFTVLFKERCSEVARTLSNANADMTGVAWTDRLWQGQHGSYSYAGRSYAPKTERPWTDVNYQNVTINSTDYYLPVKINHASEALPGCPADGVIAPYGRICSSVVEQSNTLNFDTQAKDASHPGYPTTDAFLPVWSSEKGSPYTRVVQAIDHPEDFSNSNIQPDVVARTRSYYVSQGYTEGGYGYRGSMDLGGLFPVSLQSFKFNSASGKYEQTATPGYDVREKFVTIVSQPQVHAVATLNCKAEGQCAEGPVGLTVNDVIDQSDVVSEPGAGRLKVTLKFYAWADANHMPIRRKVIDFGDGGAALDLTGFYKNHRGIKPDGSSECDSSAWGRTGESCESRYFEETKTYVCNQAMLDDLGPCAEPGALGETYPCKASLGAANGEACVFRPRVQITDNWGVCNGFCSGGAGIDTICMNRHLQGLGADPTWDNDSAKRDECVSQFNPPSGLYSFNQTTTGTMVQPWTWFAKRIFVYPLN